MFVNHGYYEYSRHISLPLKEAPLPQELVGDHIRLKQILINLVKNALKFTKKGNIKIVAAYNDIEEMLTVHVVDNGKGISQGDIKKLFKMFGKTNDDAVLKPKNVLKAAI